MAPILSMTSQTADNLVFAGFCALPLVAFFGLWLFFGKYRQGENRKAGWGSLILGNLLVLLFACSLVSLGGEVYFRFCYDTTDAFTLTKTSRRWFERHYHVNNLAVRDDHDYFPRIRSPNERRITFLGDSFTAGHGISNLQDRFAERVARQHPKWEIQVLARLGADTGDELDYLRKLAAAGYQFDQIVLVYCLNDIDDVIPEWAERYRRINQQLRRHRPNFLIEHSFFLNTIYYRFQVLAFPEIRNYYAGDRQAYFGPPWEAQKPRLKAMRDVVRANGGQLLVVTFPFLHLIGPNYEFRDVHQRLDDFWQSIGVPDLDLLPVFAPYSARDLTVNAHDAHPNELANRLAADAIGPFLEKHLGLGSAAVSPAALPRKASSTP